MHKLVTYACICGHADCLFPLFQLFIGIFLLIWWYLFLSLFNLLVMFFSFFSCDCCLLKSVLSKFAYFTPFPQYYHIIFSPAFHSLTTATYFCIFYRTIIALHQSKQHQHQPHNGLYQKIIINCTIDI